MYVDLKYVVAVLNIKASFRQKMIVYKKTDEWYIEWQRMKTSDSEWEGVTRNDNEWQRMTASNPTNENDTVPFKEWKTATKHRNRYTIQRVDDCN